MVRLPSPKENGWNKLPSKSNFCVCWPVCMCYVISVMSSSLRPYGLWPTRVLCLWDSPGKNTGVGCHALQGSSRPRIETGSLSSPILTSRFFATSAMCEEPKRKCILIAAATLYIIYCYPATPKYWLWSSIMQLMNYNECMFIPISKHSKKGFLVSKASSQHTKTIKNI